MIYGDINYPHFVCIKIIFILYMFNFKIINFLYAFTVYNNFKF